MALHENTLNISKVDPVLAMRIAILCDDESDDDVGRMFLDLRKSGTSHATLTEMIQIISRERPNLYQALLAGDGVRIVNG